MTPAARLLLLALLAAGGQVAAQAPAATRPSPPPAASSAAPATLERADIRAQLSPRRFTTLSAEIPARLARVNVKDGDTFRQGQVLVQLDCSLQASARDRARAALSGAEKNLSAQKRLDELNATGKLEVETAQAEVDKLKAELAQINTTLSKCAIVAPFAGRVAEQKARENQYVQAGQPVLEILDDAALELEFIVPSKWLKWLAVGHKFQVEIDETGKKYPARIQRLGARIDPVSQSLKASAVIDGKYPELLAGMSGRLLLTPPN